jgi:hypothetical protein
MMSRADVYLYSPLTPCAYNFPMLAATNYGEQCEDVASLSVSEYVEPINTNGVCTG